MKSNDIFVVPRPINKPSLRLFCFPYAGGSIHNYLKWIEHFEQDIEVVLVQPPGRGTRLMNTPHDNMSSLIEELMQQTDFFSQAPYILFGHSLG